MRQRTLVGAQDQSAWARGRAIAREIYSTLCADEQDRRGGRAGDLDGGAAAGNADGGGQDRRTVAAKTEDQQAMLSLHRMRALLVKFRTMQVNQLRGLLYEFGATFRAGRVAGLAEIRARMAELADALPEAMLCSLQDQLQRIDALEQDIDRLEQRIGAWQKQEAECRAIAAVPGIGKLTATALVATVGDAKTFNSGREFASFLGLVPRQSGTGGKIRLGSISKRGDPYLRTLLIHGARSVMHHAKEPTAWQREIRARRPANVAAVAAANKMARTAWAILSHGQGYQKDYVSVKPA